MAVGEGILQLLQSLGGAAQGFDEALYPTEDIRQGRANITGQEMLNARKPDYESRGVFNILAKVGQQGARRRVMEEQLRQGRAKEEADIGLKKAQAGYYESGAGLKGAQMERERARIDLDQRMLDLKAQANEIASSKNDVQREANYQKFQYMSKYAQAAVDRAKAAMEKAQTDAERSEWEEKWRMAQLEVDRIRAEAEAFRNRKMGAAAETNAATGAARIPIYQQEADTHAKDVESKSEWRASGQAGSTTLENTVTLQTENGPIQVSVDEMAKIFKDPAMRRAMGIKGEPGVVEKIEGAITGTPPPPATKVEKVEQRPTRISTKSQTSQKNVRNQSKTVTVRYKKPFNGRAVGFQEPAVDNQALQQAIAAGIVEIVQ